MFNDFQSQGEYNANPYFLCDQAQSIDGHILALVLAHADIENDLGNGLTALKVSKSIMKNAKMRLKLGAKIEKITNVTIIWSEARSAVVNVLYDDLTGQNGGFAQMH